VTGPGAGALLRLAGALAAGIAVLGLLGSLWLAGVRDLAGVPIAKFNLDDEFNFPATFSFLLLVGVALASWRWAAEAQGRDRLVRRFLAGFFAFMSLDELLSFHERLEAIAHVDWQTLYVPVVLVGGAAWVHALRRLAVRERALWAAGAAGWFVAQVFEAVEWGPTRLVHPWMIAPEETLEMTGSACWVFALLVVLTRREERVQRALRAPR
jgi:hypothetical protein